MVSLSSWIARLLSVRNAGSLLRKFVWPTGEQSMLTRVSLKPSRRNRERKRAALLCEPISPSHPASARPRTALQI